MSQPTPFEVDLETLEALPEAEREIELQKVAILKRNLERNPLWAYVPHEGEVERKRRVREPLDGTEDRGQVAFHELSKERIPVGAYVAGNRSGKTHAGSADNLIQILPPHFLPPWLLQYKRWGLDGEPVFVRSIGVDLGQWLEKVLLPKLRKLVPPDALYKGEFDKAYTERTRKLRFADGSWWDFLTHDMDVDAFAGAELHRAHFDEEPPGEKGRLQYDETLARLIDTGGDVRFTMTPLLGLSWVYHELTDGYGNPRDDEDCRVIRGDMDDNPHISDEGKQRYLARFEKEPLKLEARKRGRWVHFAGLIYPDFSESRHVVPAREIPRASDDAKPSVAIYQGIDPGINENHPVALVWAWLTAEDVLEVFHTIKRPDWTVADAAAYILDFEASQRFTPRWRVIDPSAQNRHHATGRSTQFEYSQRGIHTIPGQNSREAGFNAVTERLRTDRFRVQAHCTDLVKEFNEYRWKVSRQQSEDAPKAEPIKRHDDEIDTVRYIVMSLPKPNLQPDRETDDELPPAQRAFRKSLERLRRGKRPRIGGYIPT